MKSVSLARVKDLIDETLAEGGLDVGGSFLQELRDESKSIVGHDQPYYSLFYRLSDWFRPSLVVELGSWRAYAAAHFAEPVPDCQVITIDIHKDDEVAMLRTIMVASEMENVTYLREWTWDAGQIVEDFMKSRNISIDILYIDAWHEYKYVKREWEVYEPLLSDEALVIMDDLFDAPGCSEGMVQFWDEVPYPKFTNGVVHPGVPMGFVHYKRGQ